VPETISADEPALRLIAQLAGVAPSRMVAAFNDPERFFENLTLAELERFYVACVRLTSLVNSLTASLDLATHALLTKKLKDRSKNANR
jgi:hypothetical protein